MNLEAGRKRLVRAAWGGLFVAWMAGCSGKLPDVQDVKDAVSGQVEQAKQAIAPVVGKIDLQATTPIKLDTCFARLTSISTDRPKVLQVTSYEDVNHERFPSVFLHAVVAVDNVAALAGKQIEAQVYIQTAADAAVWHTAAGESVQVTIKAADDTSITCEIERGLLVSSADGVTVEIRGTLVGLLK